MRRLAQKYRNTHHGVTPFLSPNERTYRYTFVVFLLLTTTLVRINEIEEQPHKKNYLLQNTDSDSSFRDRRRWRHDGRIFFASCDSQKKRQKNPNQMLLLFLSHAEIPKTCRAYTNLTSTCTPPVPQHYFHLSVSIQKHCPRGATLSPPGSI